MSLISRLPKVSGLLKENADLSKINWFKIGGPADILYKPSDQKDLADFIRNKPKDIPYKIIGCGSNLLIRDLGIEGIVIKLPKSFSNIYIYENNIKVGAACLSYNLSIFARNNQLGGFEFLSGIPGTIGGNLAMNAGAYGNDVGSILIDAIILDDLGNFHKLNASEIGYIYRGNNLPNNWLFIEANFKTYEKQYEYIEKEIQEISKNRKATQPINKKTSGSTFKNPSNHKAWQLIDEAGCRGLRVGGAVISEMHCNFLINDENATARDIENLGNEVKRRVKAKFNIELDWEIDIIGRK